MKKLFILLLLASTFAFRFDGGYQVGDNAADFKLKNIDGKMVSLADFSAAKGFIVIFTCNHCPFSKMYEDRIIALNAKFTDKGYPIIAINPNDASKEPDDSFAGMQKRAKDKKFTFSYLHDENQEIARKYGAARTPHVFLLNKEAGKLKVVYIGAIDNNAQDGEKADKRYVEDAIADLLGSKAVRTNVTKAVGCTIKWKS